MRGRENLVSRGVSWLRTERGSPLCLSPRRLRGASGGKTAGLISAGSGETLPSLCLAGRPEWSPRWFPYGVRT
jgi:hypothetical protein